MAQVRREKVKVANVIEEGKLGGPQVRMARVAAALADQVDTLIVMPQASSGSFRELCEANRIHYKVLPLTRITKEWRAALAYLLYSPWEVFRLARLFRRERVDVVHASGGSWQYKAVLASVFARIPVVWHLNDTSMPAYIRLFFRIFASLADGYIFASRKSMDYYGPLVARLHKPRAIVPAPVQATEFEPGQVFSGDEDLIHSLEGDFVIGTVANVNPIKGIEVLIEAARRAKAVVGNLKVLVVGPIHENQKPYFNGLKDLLGGSQSDCVRFVGGRSDVRPLLKRMDVYVCSSLAESSPVSVWEAMAMKTPVVSTDVGDVPVHVKNGKSGYIVPVGDAQGIADRIIELYRNPDLRQRMGASAREEVKRSLSPEIVAEKTLAFYREVIDASS